MPRHPIALLALVLALAAPMLSAQTLPNFTGTWTLDVARSTVQKETPRQLVIMQTPQAVTIERQVEGQREVITYPFQTKAEILAPPTPPEKPASQGQPSTIEQIGGPTGVQSTAAEWKNGGLETTAVLMISGKAVTHTARRTLNLTGTEMTVETLLAVQHGYQTGESSASAREIYVKQAK
jgi:hypothetical protein